MRLRLDLVWMWIGVLTIACRGADAPAPAADGCERWAAEVCKRVGEQSDTCNEVKAGVALLGAEACAVALATPASLERRLAERQRSCESLRERLCTDIGPHTRACKTAREQSARFDADRCVKMLREYPEVRAKLAANFERFRVSKEAAAKLLAGDPPAKGPAQAKLQLVEFIDFENHDSANGAAILRELAAKYGDQLRVVIRMFPLPDNPHARLAAEAALAAHAQGKFWEMYDSLLANQKQLERPALERYAAQLQLDLAAFKSALDRHSYAPAVDADLALVKELSIVAMPAAFLNGERMLNAVDKQLLQAAIEEYLH